MEFCFRDAVKMAEYKEMICCFSVSIRFAHSSYRNRKIANIDNINREIVHIF